MAALLAVPARASASFLDLYGFNPRAVGMAGAQVAVADDFTAVYYNPAGLTAAEGAAFGLGLVLTRPSLTLKLENQRPDPAALEAPNATAITFGSVYPLAGEGAQRRIALGFALSIPTRSLLNGQSLDPAIPHWYMYQALPERIVAMIGLGVRPLDWLSLGAGVQLLAGLNGSLDFELDVVAGRFSRKTVLFDIEPRAAPILGLEVRPLAGLRIASSWRAAIDAPVTLPVDLTITGIAHLRVDTSFVVQYDPHAITWGASYTIPGVPLTAAVDVTWALWSMAPDPSPSSFIDVSGELFDSVGLGDVLDAPAPGQERRVDLGFRNVVIPRVGVESRLGLIDLRAGYAVQPSPAPVQSSGTNYVDGTAHHLAAGASVHFRDPLRFFASPLIADVGLSMVLLPKRRHAKIDPTDPVGSYDASGNIFVAGFALRYVYSEDTGAPDVPEDLPPKTVEKPRTPGPTP